MELNQIKDLIREFEPRLVQIRRRLHSMPELSFKEEHTSAMIRTLLDEWGISYSAGWAGHGIVGLLEGEKSGSERVIALRADMDALPIKEESSYPFPSQNEGIMHACGHDVHMSCLLGALYVLQNTRKEWSGRVKFIFQPGEELLPGGASLLIAEGVLRNPEPELILGLHVQPGLPVGKAGICAGPSMASSDELYLELSGPGGHAAMPHLAADPVLAAARIITGIQELMSRERPPMVPAVLGFGKIETEGGATNIIPSRVRLEGTFRTLDPEFRNQMHERLETFVRSTAEAGGVQAVLRIVRGYPVLVNQPEAANKWSRFASEYIGSEGLVDIPPRLTAEDFAHYTQEVPGCFFRLGTGPSSNVHSPGFVADDQSVAVGAGLLAWLSVQFLSNT